MSDMTISNFIPHLCRICSTKICRATKNRLCRTCFSQERKIKETFKKAKDLFKKVFPQFSQYIEEVRLEVVYTKDSWDIRRLTDEGKIQVNLYRIHWFRKREKLYPRMTPKFDLETALIHDLFEYCYIRYHNYPDNDNAINMIVHFRARFLENALRRQRSLRPWI